MHMLEDSMEAIRTAYLGRGVCIRHINWLIGGRVTKECCSMNGQGTGGDVGEKVHELSMLRIHRRTKIYSSCIVICMEQYMGRCGFSSWVLRLESCWNVFKINDALYNCFVDVMHRHRNFFDMLRSCARSKDFNAMLAVLVDPDRLTSTRHVQKLSHIEELDNLLCTSMCYVHLRIGGTE